MFPSDKDRPIDALDANEDMPIDALDAMYEDAALAAADDPSQITEEDRVWAEGMRRRMLARIAEVRRSLLPKHVKSVVAPPIRAAYLAMNRDQLIAKLEELAHRMGNTLQIAHRKLSELSDNDLRRLLETLDAEPREP